MEVYLEVLIRYFIFTLGTIIGSFLNVVIYRTPLKESIIKGSSHCINCGKNIKPYDLIPILSWVLLRGKCRYCGEKISIRYPFIETLTGLMFLLSYIYFDLTAQTVVLFVFFSTLIVLSMIDIDHMIIPDTANIIIAALGVLSIFISPEIPFTERLIGAFVISVPFTVLGLFGGMGGGDIKLMAAAGLLLGYNIIVAAAIGIILGAVGGIIIKAVTKSGIIKFGPFLAAGLTISVFWGDSIIKWYLGLILI